MIHKTSPEIGGMGHSIKRKEDLRFIQGKGNYVDDVHLPGMVYGQLVRSPYAHARLKSINTEKAYRSGRRSRRCSSRLVRTMRCEVRARGQTRQMR